MQWAETMVAGMLLYGLFGVLFGFAFVTLGVGSVDPAARGGPIGFRLLIFPASAALWPLMLFKWIRRRRGSAAS